MKMEGDFIDETILATIKRYEFELEREKPLGYQIKVMNRYVELDDREIYPGIQMRLPKYFSKKNGCEIESGYIIRNHPEVIFTSGCGSVNFTFDKVSKYNGDIINVREEMMGIMERSYPQNIVYETGQQNTDEMDIYWFDYKSFAADSDVYNIMFLFPDKENAVIGTFKCAFRYFKEWKAYIIKMLLTIEVE